MNRIAEEILIRTVSTVLALVIVAIIVELLLKVKKPCGCTGGKKPPLQEQPVTTNESSPFALIHI